MKNIHAHTDTGPVYYPGYISINNDDGRISISFRATGAATGGFLNITRDQLETMHADIGRYLAETVPAPAAKAERLPKQGFTVNINGSDVSVTPDDGRMSYEDICKLAEQPPETNPVVKWRIKRDTDAKGRTNGLLSHGESVALVNGMTFNCVVTGNA